MSYKKRKPVHVACTGLFMKKIYYEKEKSLVVYAVSIGSKYDIDMLLL